MPDERSQLTTAHVDCDAFYATVEKREQIKVPAGTFSAVQVAAVATSGPLQSKGKVWVWYSEDPNHTPVQMRVKLAWGTLLFRLQRIEK